MDNYVHVLSKQTPHHKQDLYRIGLWLFAEMLVITRIDINLELTNE